jgi:rubrerythrin
MLSIIPIQLENVEAGYIDKEILRAGIIAEYDAINLYEQMASLAKSMNLKKVMLDIAREEKEHVGEFQTLLLRFDRQQAEELEEGKEEVTELIG